MSGEQERSVVENGLLNIIVWGNRTRLGVASFDGGFRYYDAGCVRARPDRSRRDHSVEA